MLFSLVSQILFLCLTNSKKIAAKCLESKTNDCSSRISLKPVSQWTCLSEEGDGFTLDPAAENRGGRWQEVAVARRPSIHTPPQPQPLPLPLHPLDLLFRRLPTTAARRRTNGSQRCKQRRRDVRWGRTVCLNPETRRLKTVTPCKTDKFNQQGKKKRQNWMVWEVRWAGSWCVMCSAHWGERPGDSAGPCRALIRPCLPSCGWSGLNLQPRKRRDNRCVCVCVCYCVCVAQ